MIDALYIIAKAPRVGLAKTRLGQAIGHEAAVTLYKAFLRDLASRFANAPFECGWYVTPPDAWDDISPLVGGDGREARILFQKDGDLTERQRELFYRAAARGEERVVLIASDSPQLSVEVVEQAFRELDRHDLVFGPTYDGGYYLIGMRGFNDVFHGLLMSVGTELDNIVARAERAGLSVGRVEATFDIDVVDDIRHLRPHALARPDLAATRDALASLGLLEDPQQADGKSPAVPGDPGEPHTRQIESPTADSTHPQQNDAH